MPKETYHLSADQARTLSELEALAYERLASRGLGGLDLPGAYLEAAQRLLSAKSILILTGFPIRGAALERRTDLRELLALGNALEDLGIQVAYATDDFSAPLLALGGPKLNLRAAIHPFPAEVDVATLQCLYTDFDPDLVFSIERPGKAADGLCHSMRGEVISDLTPSLDLFFELAARDHKPTLAIGDGGNEIGMGRLYEAVVKQVPRGETIAAVTAADILMPAAVSNWGAYVLVGTLSLLCGRDLLISAETASDLLHTMVDMGAVDGATKRREATVDGYSFEENQAVVKAVHDLLAPWVQ
jgi:hypothetical protein